MKSFKLIGLALLAVVVMGVYLAMAKSNGGTILNPRGESEVSIKELPYIKYGFEQLAQRGGILSKIEVIGNKFYYLSEGKRVSGEINYPVSELSVKSPVIVMARGYVDKEIYRTGLGTHPSAVEFSKAGYITLAPDFLGYGESDAEDENALGARLSKPAEILDLLASLVSLPQVDLNRVYLWGHSNGGQIMLSVAEILGRREELGMSSGYRVKGLTLWAPVSKPFPYNILYYTDEASDSGKWLRGEVAAFERDYDVFNYSVDRYLEWIKIPIQLHQGSQDEAVPKLWSDQLIKSLSEKEKQIEYFVYPGADHNMRPVWDSVVLRDIEFFNSL